MITRTAANASIPMRAGEMDLDTVELPRSEQARGPHEQYEDHDEVRHDRVEAESDEGQVSLVSLGEHLGDSDDEPADNGTARRVEPADDRGGKGAKRHRRCRGFQPG